MEESKEQCVKTDLYCLVYCIQNDNVVTSIKMIAEYAAHILTSESVTPVLTDDHLFSAHTRGTSFLSAQSFHCKRSCWWS